MGAGIRRNGAILAAGFAIWVLAASGALAQQAAAPETAPPPAAAPGTAEASPSFEDVQGLIQRMQRQVEDMSQATRERDEALEFLEKQIQAATGRLSGTEETNEALQQDKATLNTEVETLAKDREALTNAVSAREAELAETARIRDELRLQLEASEAERLSLEQRLATFGQSQIEAKGTIEALQVELEELRGARQALETKLAGLTLSTAAAREESARILAGKDARIAELEARAAQLGAEFEGQQASLQVAEERVDLLTRQLRELSTQVTVVDALMSEQQVTIQQQQSTIQGLGSRLNEALAAKVEELSQYRSEFFGSLKAALGDRPEFRIVGDRFVFQSEVLFASGSARLDPAGETQLRQLATSLREVARTIPSNIDWILSVQGHTDKIPVGANSTFDSNWELSTERAISVVEFLVRERIPPNRLAAAGFGEYQPIDNGDSEFALRRNRRIEFKLTSG